MKKLLLIFLSLVFLTVTGCNQASNSKPSNQVIKVVDGDTFDVRLVNGKEERVRLLLVDTPETKHPKKPVQPFGPEASTFTEKTLLNNNVKLEYDIEKRDQYGRLLAYVYIDGKMLNEMLLEKGLARVVVFPPNTKYVDEFKAIQKQAQAKEIGIWSLENYNAEEKNKKNIVENKKCNIKGNIGSKGQKIYHTPNSPSYKQTKPEKWFCTKEEAEAAGFRAPR